MAYDNLIFKFKDKVRLFNKMIKEMEIKSMSKKTFDSVEIFIKEDNKKKKYIDESQSDHEPIESKDEENSEKKLKKTNSEPNLDITQEEKEKKNLKKMKKNFV